MRNPGFQIMGYIPLMRYLLLALLTLAPCFGCIVAVKDNGPHDDPPPPPPPPPPSTTRVVVAGPVSESFTLRYAPKTPEMYEAIRKACGRLNIKINDTHQPGNNDNWTVTGFHSNGYFDLHIYINRHDHKSQTTVTVKSGRYNDQQCREWTRRIHSEIGKQLGQDGKN
jgi:hypothetical protein